jgi:hypothetical protein
MTEQSIDWIRFECDGCMFEYAAMLSRGRVRPAGWPADKAAPGPSVVHVSVFVRKPGDEGGGAAMLFPEGTIVTRDHAVEAARFFWAQLTR